MPDLSGLRPDADPDVVRERLRRMSANFEGLNKQFVVMGVAAERAGRQMSVTLQSMINALRKPLNRLDGMMAAREDWGRKLWPEDADDERDDEGDHDGGR